MAVSCGQILRNSALRQKANTDPHSTHKIRIAYLRQLSWISFQYFSCFSDFSAKKAIYAPFCTKPFIGFHRYAVILVISFTVTESRNGGRAEFTAPNRGGGLLGLLDRKRGSIEDS